MKWKTLDEIVCSVLLQKGYSVHFYFQVLKYASDRMRELNYDIIPNIKTKKLTISSIGTVETPCDYVDWIKIGTLYGPDVTPMTGRSRTNRLYNYDTTGAKIPYGSTDAVNSNGSYFEWGWDGYGGWWTYNFGALQVITNGHRQGTSFKVLNERKEIQFYNWTAGDFIILEYISDASDPDNATMVHPYAQRTIETYCFWQLKAHNRSYSPAEVQMEQMNHDREIRKLKARRNEMTIEDIKRVMIRCF